MLPLVLAAAALRSAPLPVGTSWPLRIVERTRRVVVLEDEISPAPAPRPAVVKEATTATDASLPPDSFLELIEHAAMSTSLAISEGSRLVEVEFPPLPVSQLDEPSLSAYDILSSNLRPCVEFCKILARPDGPAGGKPIAITLPDVEELRRSLQYLGDAEPWPNVRLNSLGGDTAPDRNPLEGLWSNVFKQSGGQDAVVADWAGMYVVVGASCQELPTIQALHEKQPNKPLVCFNLKLDVLRGDLGLPAFPPRDVHHNFLCKSYSGVLFRRYPEGWQSLLDRGTGKKYRQVKIQEVRPALGTFKAELTEALRLGDEAADSAISQAGFKQSTWWEDNTDGRDVSFDWRR